MTTLEDDFLARAAVLREQTARELYDQMLEEQEKLIVLAFRWRTIACLSIGAVIGQWVAWVVFR